MENINPNCESCQTLAFKNQIISAILNAKNTNQGIQNYKQCLENDFREFANQEDSLQEEAEALFRLQEIQKELELIASCPSLYAKTIVAVGGGFSAGKSEFISSFFQEGEAKLAIGIEPMTAIPTYVINGEEQGLIGCTSNGASVDLTKIDPQIQSKMSHSFIKSFDFNLRSIMPFAVLQTKLNQYQNLCFVDTPGYNPSEVADGYTGEDVKTAKDFLNNAEVLLWLIGLDANGTISRSDLDFLKKLNLEDKKLYIILNKADLKMPSAIENIMQEVVSTLEFEDVVCEGISAYSSRRKKEIAYRKISLLEFLAQNNTKSKFHEKIIRELYEVKSMYRYAILKNIKEQEAILDTLHSLSLDLHQEGFEDREHVIFQRIDKLKECFDPSRYEKSLDVLDEVIDKFKKAIDEVFANCLHIDLDEVDEEDVELDVDLQVYGYGENPEGIEKSNQATMCYMRGEYQKAVEFFEESVLLGSIKACDSLGDMYRKGIGVEKNYKEAKDMYELAIKRGANFSRPYFGLGYIYQYVEEYQDYTKAKEMYEKAIKFGCDASCNNLGDMYYNGNGVQKNYTKAKELYEKAIQRGFNKDNPYYRLGYIYQNMEEYQDYAKAKEMYEKAIKLGNYASCNNLGNMYHNGNGVPQDYAKAKELYELGIQRGSGMACWNLGNEYYDGSGVMVGYDRAKARELYELGASRGNKNCKEALERYSFPLAGILRL